MTDRWYMGIRIAWSTEQEQSCRQAALFSVGAAKRREGRSCAAAMLMGHTTAGQRAGDIELAAHLPWAQTASESAVIP